MKVVELRDCLRHQSLATNDLKADLVQRLVQAVIERAQVQELPVGEVENAAVQPFAADAYWKLLKQCSTELPNLDKDGVRFREPTMPESEDVHREARVEKLNYEDTFDRSPFVGATLFPERKSNRKLKRDTNGVYTYKKIVSTKTPPKLE